MHDFAKNVDLTNRKVIYSKKVFYKPNATRPSRTFICEGGPGCLKETQNTPLGLLFGVRTISGRWASDGMKDTISSASIEAYVDDSGKEIEAEEFVAPAPAPEEIRPTTTAAPPAGEPKPRKQKEPKPERAAAVACAPGEKIWNPERAVELFKGGMKIIDIAIEMGYPRGSGCNRTKAALKKAGVL